MEEAADEFITAKKEASCNRTRQEKSCVMRLGHKSL